MNSSYRWVIVAAGALMTCVAIGAMFSLAVFLEPMSAATGWSRTVAIDRLLISCKCYHPDSAVSLDAPPWKQPTQARWCMEAGCESPTVPPL